MHLILNSKVLVYLHSLPARKAQLHVPSSLDFGFCVSRTRSGKDTLAYLNDISDIQDWMPKREILTRLSGAMAVFV